jgi:two-component system response regulator AtoC
VAEAARALISFDGGFLLRVDEPTGARLSFFESGQEEADRQFPLSEIPDALRSDRGSIAVGDVASAIQPTSQLGSELASRGLRSLLAVALPGGNGAAREHLVFGSTLAGAFGPDEERLASGLATILRRLLDDARALGQEREARSRLESLSKLVPTFATTLDVRDVFPRVSEVAREVIPHEALGIQLLQPGGERIVAFVVADSRPGDTWEYPILREMAENEMTDAVVDELWFDGDAACLRARLFPEGGPPEGREVVARMTGERSEIARRVGFRSFLRTSLRRGAEKIGALVFAQRTTHQFHPSQREAAHRIADYVSMALAHRHLAEEAERTAEARARAATLEGRVEELIREAEAREGFHRCVGRSRSWKEALGHATRVAATDTTVLLTGESGTGKEVLARFIHRGSPRANGPLVPVNCAALPEQLLESELFGYERGAFSGAVSTKPGRLEQAARGVLFLDEIGEMSLSLQAKLLRVLQEKEFQRLGGTRVLRADVRVIAATNRDLVAAMKRSEFREDLFYRLRVFEIRLPPLRERRDDILPLTEAFLADLERTLGRRTSGLSEEAREILLAHDWPGNVRELRNALERAVILCDGGLITGEQLPLFPAGTAATTAGASDMTIDQAEKALIEKALLQARHNKSKAARLLGLSRAQLYFRLEKYGLLQDR